MEHCIECSAKEYVCGMRLCEGVAAAALGLFCAFLRGGSSVSYARRAAERLCAVYGVNCCCVSISSRVAKVCAECGGAAVSKSRRFSFCVADFSVAEKCSRILRLAEGGADLSTTESELRSLDNIRAPFFRRSLGGGLASGAFCAFFGGGRADVAAALLIGFAVCAAMFALENRSGAVQTFFLSAAGGALVSAYGLLARSFSLECSLTAVVFGSIMPVIPGLKLCNSLGEAILGETFYGLCGVFEALLSTAAVAAGYAAASALFSASATVAELPTGAICPYGFACCAVGAAGFCLMFNCRASRVLQGGVAGLCCCALCALCSPCGEYASLFLATFLISFASLLFAEAKKIPPQIFMIPAIVPLVPGAALYCAAENILCGNAAAAATCATGAVCAFFAVAAGGAFSACAANFFYGVFSGVFKKNSLLGKRFLSARERRRQKNFNA